VVNSDDPVPFWHVGLCVVKRYEGMSIKVIREAANKQLIERRDTVVA
jgi:hypothetical protein